MGTSLDDGPLFDATIVKRIIINIGAHRGPNHMHGLEKWQIRNGDIHDQVRVFRQVSEPMRHENHRPTFSFLPEVGKKSVFGFRIEGRAGLVYSNELYGRGEEAHERART